MRRFRRLVGVFLALELALQASGTGAFLAFGQMVEAGASRSAGPHANTGALGTVPDFWAKSGPAAWALGPGVAPVKFQGSLPLPPAAQLSFGAPSDDAASTAVVPEPLLSPAEVPASPLPGPSPPASPAAPSEAKASLSLPAAPGAGQTLEHGQPAEEGPAPSPDEEAAGGSAARFDGSLVRPRSEIDAVVLGESIAWPRRLFLAGHYAAVAVGTLAMAAGLGLAAFLPAAVLACVDVGLKAKKLSHRPQAFNSNLYGEARRKAEEEGGGLLRLLVERMGLDASSAPRFALSNDHGGPMGGAADGAGVGRDAAVMLGEGYQFRKAEQAAGVMGHELGHLHFGDPEKVGFLRRTSGGWMQGLRARFRKLERGVFSTHPDHASREERLRRMAEEADR
ncbi:MAG: hypothetical protein HY748_18665 [Elusimicrobia bacterium]|nr:hypothetical protein [Elusimicrobiota bacterium]